jgi:hypothetical protein
MLSFHTVYEKDPQNDRNAFRKSPLALQSEMGIFCQSMIIKMMIDEFIAFVE